MPKSISINTDGRLLEFTPAIADISGLQTALDGKATSSHVHGNITNAGAIGSTSGLPIITTALGVLTAGAFGTIAGSFCQGNDSRLSDARTPVAHNQAWSTITSTPTTRSGYGITDAAGLGANTFTGYQLVDIGSGALVAKFKGGAGANISIDATAGAGNDWRFGDALTASVGTFVFYDYTNSSKAFTYHNAYGWEFFTSGLSAVKIDSTQKVIIGTDPGGSELLRVGGSVKSSGGFFKGVNEAVYANDSRLSDARTPTAHNQDWSTITGKPTTISGYGLTDAAGLVANTFTDTQTIQGTTLQTLRLNNTSSTGFINSINTNNAGGFFIKDEENNRIFFNYDRSTGITSIGHSNIIKTSSSGFHLRGGTITDTTAFGVWTGTGNFSSQNADTVTTGMVAATVKSLINTLVTLGVIKSQ